VREPELEVVDELGPEALGPLDREALQLVVIGTAEPPHQPRHVCARDELGRRRPDDVAHCHRVDSLGLMRARLLDPELRKWWTLFAVAFGLFMIMLDNTVVNVALPSIRQDLGISISELEWVVNGYALTFGVLLLSGGKLADMLGRRRIFMVGLVIFTLSSFFCGFANSAGVLIGARVVQGVGAALMNPATLSIITATFPPRQRGTAIGIW